MTERKVCPTHAPWTAGEDDIIREWWGRESTSIMAERLPGRTRNAIIGRAHRLKLLQLRKQPAVRKHPEHPEPRKEEPAVPIIPDNVHLLRPTRQCKGVPIWELRDRHCRFIVREGTPEEVRYCAEDVTGETSSWCAEHRAIVFRSAPEATGRPFILTTRRAAA